LPAERHRGEPAWRAVLRGAAFATELADQAVSLAHEHHLRSAEVRSAVGGRALDRADPRDARSARARRASGRVLVRLNWILSRPTRRCEAMPIFAAVVQPVAL